MLILSPIMFGLAQNDKSKVGSAYNHVLKCTGLFGGVQGMTVLVSLVRNKFITVLLGSVGLALIDIFNHAMTLFSNATTFGVPLTAVRRLSELYEKGDEARLEEYIKVIRSWSLLTALLGMSLCALLARLSADYFLKSDEYTLSFLCISPLVGMLAISGVELAILKALRRLRDLSVATTVGAVLTLFLTVPFYFIFGNKGIVPALLLSTLAVMVVNLYFSTKQHRWRANPFSVRILKQGTEMLRLGFSYVLAGIVASAAEMAVRAFIVEAGSLAEEGLYCSGFMLTVTYARFVFVSLEADYFPRLSADCSNVQRMNETINRQVEVSVLLMAPFLLFFALFLPYIIHLLFSAEFLKVVPMTLCSLYYMYFKALTTPVAYCTLAHGDSVTYFVAEFIYYVVFMLLVIGGYLAWGLIGAGIALSLSNLFDMLMVALICRYKYQFHYSSRAVSYGVVQGVLLSGGIWAAFQGNLWLKYGAGLPLLVVSTMWSLRMLSNETTIVSSLKERAKYFFKKK